MNTCYSKTTANMSSGEWSTIRTKKEKCFVIGKEDVTMMNFNECSEELGNINESKISNDVEEPKKVKKVKKSKKISNDVEELEKVKKVKKSKKISNDVEEPEKVKKVKKSKKISNDVEEPKKVKKSKKISNDVEEPEKISNDVEEPEKVKKVKKSKKISNDVEEPKKVKKSKKISNDVEEPEKISNDVEELEKISNDVEEPEKVKKSKKISNDVEEPKRVKKSKKISLNQNTMIASKKKNNTFICQFGTCSDTDFIESNISRYVDRPDDSIDLTDPKAEMYVVQNCKLSMNDTNFPSMDSLCPSPSPSPTDSQIGHWSVKFKPPNNINVVKPPSEMELGAKFMGSRPMRRVAKPKEITEDDVWEELNKQAFNNIPIPVANLTSRMSGSFAKSTYKSSNFEDVLLAFKKSDTHEEEFKDECDTCVSDAESNDEDEDYVTEEASSGAKIVVSKAKHFQKNMLGYV